MHTIKYLKGRYRQAYMMGCIWFILGLTSFSNHSNWGKWITIAGAILMVTAKVLAKRKNT